MLRALLGEDVGSSSRSPRAVPAIQADRGPDLEQVLMNLAVNARDAMPTAAGRDRESLDDDRACHRR